MRDDTADAHAAGYQGVHDGFSIVWLRKGSEGVPTNGWYVRVDGAPGYFGPHETSQAAFGAVVEAIDRIISEVNQA